MKPILVTHNKGEVNMYVPYPGVALSHGQAIVLATGIIEAAIEARSWRERVAREVTEDVIQRLMEK